MSSQRRRYRVLALAEAANPDWVSVPLVGWSHAASLAEVTDLHLVTQIRNREAIRGAGWVEGEGFTAIDSEAVSVPLWRLGERLRGGAGRGWTLVTALTALRNYYFEQLVWRQFGGRIRAGEFDVIHRITPVSPTAPSLLAPRAKAAGVPFVLGPLNGGLPWPVAFGSARRAEFEWLSYLRDAYRFLPGYRSSRSSAAAILVGSRATWSQVPRSARSRCVYLPENAIDPSRFRAVSRSPVGKPLRAVFVGRLVPYKMPDILLEAATPVLRSGALHLDLVGDGPLRQRLEDYVRREDLADQVTFSGWVEHARVQEHLGQADLLTFPSIREFGGGVVLEAMALGVVPVVVDYGGPGELVTPQTGFSLPLGGRAQIVSSLQELLQRLVREPGCLAGVSERAQARVGSHFTWSRKAQQVVQVYDWVCGHTDKPRFGFIPRPSPESGDLPAETLIPGPER